MAHLSPPDSQAPREVARTHTAEEIQELSRKAVVLHQRGELAEAEQVYRKILTMDPLHSDSLHLLGVLAHQVGRDDVAIALIQQAIAIDKNQASYHSNLGTALHALGNLSEAAVSYRNALFLNPQMAEAHLNLGAVLQAQGKTAAAEARFRQALAIKPDLAEAYVNLGNILLDQGKREEAAASHEKALTLKPDLAAAHFNLGNAHQAQGQHKQAVGDYERALALNPNIAEVHGNLGNTLLAQDKLDDAVASYKRALTLKPEYADAWYNLGNARQGQEKLNEAVDCYTRALSLKPHFAEAHYNLGNALHAQERFEEAAASYENALLLRPEYAEAHYNLGCTFQEMGRLDEALACMSSALAFQPDYPQAFFARALTQLKLGDFAAGWGSYEGRWESEDHHTPRRPYSRPLWNGEHLDGGRLFLWGEQGVGDEIMFAGLIPDALRSGNRVVLDCDSRLRPLFARSFPQIEVISSNSDGPLADPSARLESSLEFAAHLPTGSLPGLFRSSEAAFSVQASSYLKADPEERARFRSAYADGRKLVGLAWYTRNSKSGRKRTIELGQFAPLFANEDLRWVSLQYGDFDSLEELATAAGAPLLVDRTVDQFSDIDRFAAQVAAMDMVVTIDNSTAHLAGALGIPVCLLLPFASDWRWLQARSDSPWYPSMRILRQPRRGDWASVIVDVQASLEMQ